MECRVLYIGSTYLRLMGVANRSRSVELDPSVADLGKWLVRLHEQDVEWQSQVD